MLDFAKIFIPMIIRFGILVSRKEYLIQSAVSRSASGDLSVNILLCHDFVVADSFCACSGRPWWQSALHRVENLFRVITQILISHRSAVPPRFLHHRWEGQKGRKSSWNIFTFRARRPLLRRPSTTRSLFQHRFWITNRTFLCKVLVLLLRHVVLWSAFGSRGQGSFYTAFESFWWTRTRHVATPQLFNSMRQFNEYLWLVFSVLEKWPWLHSFEVWLSRWKIHWWAD